jgi:hypothetical protein
LRVTLVAAIDLLDRGKQIRETGPAEWVRGSDPAALGLLFLRLAAQQNSTERKKQTESKRAVQMKEANRKEKINTERKKQQNGKEH